ncbi:hypothetical protein [Blastomonas sp.]|uniref:hypothetical protein n=1 Tax=Blastomonas sp. TaxID=1909299 RepID=UPI002626A784|nr:hypothetical protein [Blastomonas sp.]MDM7955147.1 hypothetical protein [Blastomonas sp.]
MNRERAMAGCAAGQASGVRVVESGPDVRGTKELAMAHDSQTQSRGELLVVALQDLWQARSVIRDQMKAVEDATVDTQTRAVLGEIRTAAADDQPILSALVSNPGDTPNLWAKGIFEDASRDVATTAQGAVRDIALIGAIRKLLAADIVSLETAIRLGIPKGRDFVEPIAELQAAAYERDQCLRARLQALTREDQ